MSDYPKLLRAIAGGTQAQENKHDIILNGAAADNERLSAAVDAKIIEAGEMRLEIERLRSTLGYLADNIDNPALVAVAEAALKPKPEPRP